MQTEAAHEELLLIGGVRKSGTSSLFQALAEHPGVDVPRMKEPQFLALHPDTVRANLAWYREQFEDRRPGNLLLDGSTWCFTSPWTVQVLREHFPSARLLVVLRDPAKRAFSGFLHMVKLIPIRETRSFDEILDGLESRGDSVSLAEAEDSLLGEARARGRVDSSHSDANFHRVTFDAPFETSLHDPFIDYKYFGESLYSHFLPPLEQALGENLKIVLFERLKAEPESVLEEVREFARLPADVALALRHENPTFVPRGRLVRAAMAARSRFSVLDRAAGLLKSLGLEAAGRRFRTRFLMQANPRISAAENRRARTLLADEYAYWAERLPETTEFWKP